MAEHRTIRVIRCNVDERAAMRMAEPFADRAAFHVDQTLYYPYRQFSGTGRVPALFSNRSLVISCLVDGRQGLAATADPFDDTARSVVAGDLLEADLPVAQAEKAARRFLSHVLTRSTKSIARFHVDLSYVGLVHKAFWLLRDGQRGLIVDSVTGQLHNLRRAA